MKTAQNLEVALQLVGMGQVQLADEIDVNKTTLNNWVRKGQIPKKYRIILKELFAEKGVDLSIPELDSVSQPDSTRKESVEVDIYQLLAEKDATIAALQKTIQVLERQVKWIDRYVPNSDSPAAVARQGFNWGVRQGASGLVVVHRRIGDRLPSEVVA